MFDNFLLLVLVPLILLGFISQLFLFLCKAYGGDKFVFLLIVSVLQLIGSIYIISFFNDLGFCLFLFWVLIFTILFNVFHCVMSSNDLGVRLSKGVFFFLIFLVQSILFVCLFVLLV